MEKIRQHAKICPTKKKKKEFAWVCGMKTYKRWYKYITFQSINIHFTQLVSYRHPGTYDAGLDKPWRINQIGFTVLLLSSDRFIIHLETLARTQITRMAKILQIFDHSKNCNVGKLLIFNVCKLSSALMTFWIYIPLRCICFANIYCVPGLVLLGFLTAKMKGSFPWMAPR